MLLFLPEDFELSKQYNKNKKTYTSKKKKKNLYFFPKYKDSQWILFI